MFLPKKKKQVKEGIGSHFIFQDVWFYVSDHIMIIWVVKIFLYSSFVYS